ncbi:MAG: hypothetical protein H7125_09350 [Proteobacteria bacterium]|nr:hypothetical protein [Burkholderiales bacterium]
MRAAKRIISQLLLGLSLLSGGTALVQAQERNAPGFKSIEPGARIVVMPIDVEIFEFTAGGMEPRADWTSQAGTHLRAALLSRKTTHGALPVDLPATNDELIEELQHLHRAVGGAISLHHFGMLKLPTKDGKLDWSLGDEVKVIREKAKADYALFTWVRDSHASGGRVAMMIFAAGFGIGLPPPMQLGYASLVELTTGRIVWFNQLMRGSGDLREAEPARESMEALLRGFPG